MGIKIKNLQHIDGKKVTHSTITSQHPEAFVQRKKNTGELIITSDTVSDYGMHHIYLGGEHIAGGYGFATTQVRDDLCYVQQSYNGIFNYFNQAYTYQGNAYISLRKYAQNAYAYMLSAINYNTYLNTSVSNEFNKIYNAADGTTYTFEFRNGYLYVLPNDILAIKLSVDNGNVIYNENKTTYVLLSEASKTNYNNGTFNDEDAKYINSSIYVNVNNYSDSKFTVTSLKDITSNILNYSFKMNNGVTTDEYQEQARKEILQTTGHSNFIFPLFTNLSTSYIQYSYVLPNNTLSQTNTLYFKWEKPIMYGTLVDSQFETIKNEAVSYHYGTLLQNEKVIDFDKVSYTYVLINKYTPNNYSYTNYKYLYVATPKGYTPSFYMGTDVSKRATCEGGLIKQDIELTYYDLYVSEPQYFNRTVRVDIDFEKQ